MRYSGCGAGERERVNFTSIVSKTVDLRLSKQDAPLRWGLLGRQFYWFKFNGHQGDRRPRFYESGALLEGNNLQPVLFRPESLPAAQAKRKRASLKHKRKEKKKEKRKKKMATSYIPINASRAMYK